METVNHTDQLYTHNIYSTPQLARAPSLTSSVELITPEIAREMLKSNAGNRPVSRRHVQTLVRAIKSGEFVVNGEAIKFGVDGRLIDGQHRLLAIIEAGIAIRSLVIRGIPVAAFSTLDTGRKRTGGDILALLDVADPNVVASAARVAMAIDVSQAGGSFLSVYNIGISHTALAQWVEESEERRECFWVVAASKTLRSQSMAYGAACGIYKYGGSAKRAREFFAGFASGANLSATNPIFHARNYWLKNRVTTMVDRAASVAVLIKAWNAWSAGSTALRVTWAPSREDFPLIRRA